MSVNVSLLPIKKQRINTLNINKSCKNNVSNGQRKAQTESSEPWKNSENSYVIFKFWFECSKLLTTNFGQFSSCTISKDRKYTN